MCRVKRALLLFALLAAAAACEGPTDPNPTPSTTGRLSGLVTIGPNCPIAQGTCPTPASAYDARKILVYNAGRTRLLHTVDIDSRGAYLIDLPAPNAYDIDLRGLAADRTADLPKTLSLRPGNVTTLNVSIDTGIR
jgi:hypothetical protein